MSYNLTTMQSIYHGQDEIVEIKHNNVSVYQKSIVSEYLIKYTTTDNQQITPYNTSGLTILEHTFVNNVGRISVDPQTSVIPQNFLKNCTTLLTVEYGENLTFNDRGYQHDGCTNLENVKLPDKMTKIVQRTFRDNPLIREVTIPATVNTISASWPFYHTNLQNGTYLGPTLIFKSSSPVTNFTDTGSTQKPFSPNYPNTIIDTIYVPDESVSDYQNATYFNEIPNILPISQYPTV